MAVRSSDEIDLRAHQGDAGPVVVTRGAAGLEENRVRWHLGALVLIAVLNLLDLVTTELVLARGGTELNPVADFLIGSDMLWVTKLALVGFLLVRGYRAKPTDRLVAASWFVAGIYAMVVVMNTITLARA